MSSSYPFLFRMSCIFSSIDGSNSDGDDSGIECHRCSGALKSRGLGSEHIAAMALNCIACPL